MKGMPLPITQARDQLTSLPEQFAEEPGTIAVMRRGKPVLAIMPWEFYESLMETLEVLSDEKLIKDFKQAVQEVARGETTPWERAKLEI
jgi:PHD/YefM family antitoxin component YafN of YafNO toxin-antitoxin module